LGACRAPSRLLPFVGGSDAVLRVCCELAPYHALTALSGVQTDEDLVCLALTSDELRSGQYNLEGIIDGIDRRFFRRKRVMMAAVQLDGTLLAYASNNLRNNREIVKLAVTQSGYALKFASEILQDDPEIVKLAVEQEAHAICYASERLRNDPELAAIAAKQP
jgi:hypothetical protein